MFRGAPAIPGALGGWLLAACLCAATAARADEVSCGPLDIGAFGSSPLDYRAPVTDKLRVVEQYHFTREVETLRRPKSGGTVGDDLDYTLRAVPNHHRALAAMMNLAIRDKTTKPVGSNFSVECWFDRAERHTPTDATVLMLWGTYRAKLGDKARAIELLEKADSLGAGNPNLHYNLGLIYLDVGKPEKAMEHAAMAYAGGFSLPGLQRKLEAAKAWRPDMIEKARQDRDAPPETEASAPAASPATTTQP